MRRLWAALIAASCLAAAPAGATVGVTEADDFKVETLEDIVDLCSTPGSDRLYTAAVNFCQGFLVGAYRYHKAMNSGPKSKDFVCFPNPTPSRSEAIALFIAWAKAHPQYGKENPVEALFKFLTEKWPCKRK